MTEQELARKGFCGEKKEIDEYLHGTICEVEPDMEEMNDIEAPDDDFMEEVVTPHEPIAEPDDRYDGLL